MILILPTNESDARAQAIEWQQWVAEQDLSYGEFAEAQAHFEKVAELFPALRDELKENGII